ncbi:OLC1v1036753C1 [Oldenlandia corymbosa var. corymbosa]|uniref:OLC1v1036753C1 n=1 Tax=Oldenlandia corymbosa var. corymbosa TaxID=529605 RepID=A0AAV1CWZ1_OLDCO|nr:OLC1v1036753C1 [Oldenlandia corymbosa var. corymbosa]
MGNCVLRGFGGGDENQVTEMVKVVTLNGGIMELYPPITAGCITGEFPDHGIFLRQCPTGDDDHEQSNLQISSHPLLDTQQLHPGRLYYLLPLKATGPAAVPAATSRRLSSSADGGVTREKRRKQEDTAAELPRYNAGNTGVWKVRLVIKPEQLSEILSHESRTEELIESVRTAAKFGATATGNYINNNNNHIASTRSSPSSWVSSMAANNYYSNRSSVSSSWRIEH